jgi:putative solute:sodium symporter small subunit
LLIEFRVDFVGLVRCTQRWMRGRRCWGRGGFSMPLKDRRRYWRTNLSLTATLLSLWFVVTFGVGYFARDLSFDFFGWPFSFWMAAQGAPAVYVLIVGFYAWYMNRLDAKHGVEEPED